jgi:glycosyltransferase involved in cell wall biosynthesis
MSLASLLKGQLHFMNQYFDVIGISSPGEYLVAVKGQEGINTYGIEMTRRITPLKDLVALWQLYKIFRNERPQVVHTHTPKAGTLGMIASFFAQVPVRLHTIAGLPLIEAKGLKRKLLDVVEKITYACATKIYPNSNGLAEFIIDNKYCSSDKVKVIGYGSSNGIDTAFFSRDKVVAEQVDLIRDRYQLSAKYTVFCFVGRIVGDKGINELVEAFMRIYKVDSNTRLLLVGPFEKDLDRLKDETEKSISNHPGIIWTGYQDDIRPFLVLSDVFTFPSYREGFPNVVMQAGAMSLPCIVSDINGCNEIITDGVNGLVIPTKNSEALYNAMEYLRINKKCRKELSVNGRQIIVDRYERQYVWDKLLEEYRSVT